MEGADERVADGGSDGVRTGDQLAPVDGDEEAGDPDRVALVRFRVGGFPLAAEAGHVARVAPVPERTRLPGAPDPVVGLGYLGGEPTVLLTLHGRLGVDPGPSDRRVVVLRTGDDRPVGVLADGAGETVAVPVDAVVPPDEVADPFAAETAADGPFRAVCSVDGGWVYVLSPHAVSALTVPDGEGS